MHRLTLVGLCEAYVWSAVPMKVLGRAGKVAEGAVKGCAGGYSIYKVTRRAKGRGFMIVRYKTRGLHHQLSAGCTPRGMVALWAVSLTS